MDLYLSELTEDQVVPGQCRPKVKKAVIKYQNLRELNEELKSCIAADLQKSLQSNCMIPHQCFVYGVVSRVEEGSDKPGGTYCIRIKDETMSDVKVRIVNDTRTELGPVIPRNSIIRIHRITVQLEFNELKQQQEMAVSTCPHHNYIFFIVDQNGLVRSKTSAKNPSWTIADQRRVFQLSRWMRRSELQEAATRGQSSSTRPPRMESPRVRDLALAVNRKIVAVNVQRKENPQEDIERHSQNQQDIERRSQNQQQEIERQSQNQQEDVEQQNQNQQEDVEQHSQNQQDIERQSQEIEQQIQDIYVNIFRNLVCKIVDVRVLADYIDGDEDVEPEVALRVMPRTMLNINTRRLFLCAKELETTTIDISVLKSSEFIDRNIFQLAREFCHSQVPVVISGINMEGNDTIPIITIDGSNVEIKKHEEEELPGPSGIRSSQNQVGDNAVATDSPEILVVYENLNNLEEDNEENENGDLNDSFHTACSSPPASPSANGQSDDDEPIDQYATAQTSQKNKLPTDRRSPAINSDSDVQEDADSDATTKMTKFLAASSSDTAPRTEQNKIQATNSSSTQAAPKLLKKRLRANSSSNIAAAPQTKKKKVEATSSSGSDTDARYNYHLEEAPKPKKLNFFK